MHASGGGRYLAGFASGENVIWTIVHTSDVPSTVAVAAQIDACARRRGASPMMAVLVLLLRAVRSSVRTRAALQIEVLAIAPAAACVPVVAVSGPTRGPCLPVVYDRVGHVGSGSLKPSRLAVERVRRKATRG